MQFDAVVTIAPRHDVSHNDTEIPEAMVTCICQVGLSKSNWQKGECALNVQCVEHDNNKRVEVVLNCTTRQKINQFNPLYLWFVLF